MGFIAQTLASIEGIRQFLPVGPILIINYNTHYLYADDAQVYISLLHSFNISYRHDDGTNQVN